MYAKVAILGPPFSTLTYKLPEDLPSGIWVCRLRVLVPLGSSGRLRSAVIADLSSEADLPEKCVLREILWPLEKTPLITDDLFAVCHDLALRQSMAVGAVLFRVLPPALRSPQPKMHFRSGGKIQRISIGQIRDADPCQRRLIAEALAADEFRFFGQGEEPFAEERLELRCDPPWPVRGAAKRQIEVLDYIFSRGPCERGHMLGKFGARIKDAIGQLEKKGLIGICSDDAVPGSPIARAERGTVLASMPFELNDAQKKALESCVAALHAQGPATYLLFGVTGSGKTAVYMQLARAALNMGRSVLLLAPEVALACKIRRDAQEFFPGQEIIFHHGYQSPSRKHANFLALAGSGQPRLVVGTRSALFLPLKNLGCIVMDEEHDASYKQDEGMIFQAKELAWSRMRFANGLLLLASATPDIKTFYAAQNGKVPVLYLPERIGSSHVPPIEFVQLGQKEGKSGRHLLPEILAEESEAAIRDAIARDEQVVVLLNRRGYAPLVHCVSCGAIQKCPHCQIGLAYHKGLEKLVCHYCDYSVPYPSPCRQCGSLAFLPLGEGTERLAERLAVIAGQPILRLDRDSTRRQGSMEEILKAFGDGKSQILVGTQMISKGHHFPRVTLSLVADGDIGLNMPDYRAAERTFQLLVQSAGRAGRGERDGRVIIQTRDTANYCWEYIRQRDYEGFFQVELGRRKKFRYPPFACLAMLRISCDAGIANFMQLIDELGHELRSRTAELDIAMLGPVPAPLAMLRGRKRFQCILKAATWPPLRAIYAHVLKLRLCQPLRISLDLDPVNML